VIARDGRLIVTVPETVEDSADEQVPALQAARAKASTLPHTARRELPARCTVIVGWTERVCCSVLDLRSEGGNLLLLVVACME
jgi:hypothetical protein